ncbi:type II secretion system F family protein [Ahrensia kielensis]|uniref:type II secretion system F family protein n=1 Tax=Ahrensia kielensis TaxID=76980 RepID=UPI0004757CC1|nr:type II secretion system F family protein [Ahrensia kielensis]
MFGLSPIALAVMALAGLSIGGVMYALMLPSLQAEKDRKRRVSKVKSVKTDSVSKRAEVDRAQEGQKRRKQITESLNDLEERNKAREKNATKPNLKTQIQQAGLKLDIRMFYIYSAVFGGGAAIAALIFGVPAIYSIGIAFAAGFGLPRWIISYLRKRRVKSFLAEFPNSIDIIVRAIKSGLPLNDGLRLIATEAREPVQTEFRRIIEAQQLGMSVPEACLRMYQTMPCSEANFFAIVIQIQSQAGGNLSEALGNLSGVLRARAQMKAKVAAMSMEAKASAAIIAALPPIVTLLVHLSSPDYIKLLFITDTGLLILGVSAIWMSIGVFIMRQMINFDI